MQAQAKKHNRSDNKLGQAEEVRADVVRMNNLKKLLAATDGSLISLAVATNMSPQRLDEALKGFAGLGKETAAHIEFALRLPGGWLDNEKQPPKPALPEATVARLKAAADGVVLDDEDAHDQSEGDGVQAEVTEQPPIVAQAEATPGLFAAARALQPAIFKKPARSAGEDMAAAAGSAVTTGSVEVESDDGEADTQSASAQPGRKRGRKPGVRTIPDELQAYRLKQLLSITKMPGSKTRLCRLLNASDSYVSHLVSGRRTITNDIAHRIAEVLELPATFFEMDGANGPTETLIHNALASAAHQAEEQKKAGKPARAKPIRDVQEVPVTHGLRKAVERIEDAKTEAAPVRVAPVTPLPVQVTSAVETSVSETAVAVAEDKVVASIVAMPAAQVSVAAASVAAPGEFEFAGLSDALSAVVSSMLHKAIAQRKLSDQQVLSLIRILTDALES